MSRQEKNMNNAMGVVRDYCRRMSEYDAASLLEEVCRSEEITDDTVMLYYVCCANYGFCSSCVGMWCWAKDVKELALYMSEVQLKSVVSEWHDEELEDVMEVPCSEYIRSTDVGTPEVREALAGFAEELYTMIALDDFRVDMLNDWGKRLGYCLDQNSNHTIDMEAFCNVIDAIELLEEHEGNATCFPWEEDEDDNAVRMPLKERFREDIDV